MAAADPSDNRGKGDTMTAGRAFIPLTPPATLVPVTFHGTELALPDGANLAAALLAAGIDTFRFTPVSGRPRAPYCMMGACFDCLVDIDGATRQACMMTVTEGMVIARAGTGQADDTD